MLFNGTFHTSNMQHYTACIQECACTFSTTCSRECAHAFQWDFSHETHFRDTFAFSQSENGLSQWCHQRIIALLANDDEFVSNIALIESVKNWKNCCILWESRIEEYKVIEKKTANWAKLAQNLRLFVGRYARFVGLHPVYTKTWESCCQWMFTDSNCSQSAVNDWWSV